MLAGLRSALLCFATILSAASTASATIITFDTRAYAGGTQSSAASYAATVEALVAASPTSGYGHATLSAFDNVSNHRIFGGPTSNVASRSVFDFGVASAGDWAFRFGVDFGLGGAIYVDGSAVALRTTDMWWGGSYSTTQSFTVTTPLSLGNHQIKLYGLENCCDGAMQGQFKAPGGNWTVFAAADTLNFATSSIISNAQFAVPEPSTIAMFGLALIGLAMVGRRSAS